MVKHSPKILASEEKATTRVDRVKASVWRIRRQLWQACGVERVTVNLKFADWTGLWENVYGKYVVHILFVPFVKTWQPALKSFLPSHG